MENHCETGRYSGNGIDISDNLHELLTMSHEPLITYDYGQIQPEITDVFEPRNISDEDLAELSRIYNGLLHHEIPAAYPKDISRAWKSELLKAGLDRYKFIENGSFALISNDWVKPLSEWIGNRKCLEIMSGTGMLSRSLQDFNVSIRATDDFSWKFDDNTWITESSQWCCVEKFDCISAIQRYGVDVDIIICSWPYINDIAYQSLLKMRSINPDCVMIYIGEDKGGCTASEEFFKAVEIVKDPEFKRAITEFKHWYNISDYPYLLK